eukprot:c24773_g1_i1 orf=392-3226(+)
MCILCVVSRWSRRIVTMLPWLVIPFIITWAFSQLLPPGYRLEVTSTRLACLGVLLSSLGWYELLMPWLSSWRARRSAMLRERKLIEAQEAAKWRKEATRRCRNCLTPYKIQTPGCGRFMCTYCGHVSKRPVLEVPASLSHVGGQGLHRASHPGAHAGGQLVNGAGTVSFRGSAASHDAGCWSRSSERKSCWLGEGACGGENCKAWQTFVKVFSYVERLFSFAGNLLRKVTGAGKCTAESCRTAQKVKDDLASSHESRGEKARKKANEKRQARLEKELLEAEERKQREEVARLVEERRRQREEKLRVEKESEKEAAAEREREIRRVRESERRRKEKVKERAGDQVEVKAEQEMHAANNNIKCGEEVDADTSAKPADAFKKARVSAGINRDQGARFKVATENLVRSDFPKHTGTVKRRLIPAFRMGSVFQSNGSWSSKADNMLSGGKAGKAEATVSPSSSRLSQKSVEIAQSSVSGWREAPRFNAWAKGSESLKDHCIQTHIAPTNIHGERLDQTLKDGVNSFSNKAVGAKQSSSAVGSTAIQPPIAPPSMKTASIHQLFSSPTICPPLAEKISGQAEQMLQAEIKASFMPEHTFFETPACVTLHSCKPVTEISMPLSPSTPAAVQDSLFSPCQPTLNADNGTPHYIDVPQHFTPLRSANVPETTKSTDMHCNPVSPHSVSVSNTTTFELMTNLSPTCVSSKLNEPNCNLEKLDATYWEMHPVCLENTDGFSEGAQEHMWATLQLRNRKLHELLEPSQNKEPMDQEALQLPHLSTVQSLFDSEILWPESLSLSPQKEGSLSLTGDNLACAAQVFDRKSLWSDISAFNAAVQIWDDADTHQKLPPEFVDCITQEIMRDPVITADGHSYERTAIETWLKDHDTSPKTGEVLPPPPGGVGVDKTLRPNHILRGQIIEYKEKLAKMQPNAVSWSQDGDFLPPSTLGVLSF